MRVQVCSFTTLLLLLWASPAAGYSTTSNKFTQSSPGAPVTITYSYSNLLDGGLVDKDGVPLTPIFLKDAVEEALAVWTDYAPLNFVEVEDNGPTASDAQHSCSACGQIRIGHHYIGEPGGTDVKAHAYYTNNHTGFGRAGDIHLDDSNNWEVIGQFDLVTGVDFPDVMGVVIHEAGHSLGIAHSSIDGAVMFPHYLRQNGPGTGHLTPDDIAAVQAIYGVGTGSVAPLIESVDDLFDIIPRRDDNPVNLNRDYALSMTLLSSEMYDVAQIDPESLKFGDPDLLAAAGSAVEPYRTRSRDFNDDGLLDLKLIFRTEDLLEAGAIGPTSTEGTLSGWLFDGTRIAGTDDINIYPICSDPATHHKKRRYHEVDWHHKDSGEHGDDWDGNGWGGFEHYGPDWGSGYTGDFDRQENSHWNGDDPWYSDNGGDWSGDHDGYGHDKHWHNHESLLCRPIPEPSALLLGVMGIFFAVLSSRARRDA